jgi:hypothetical protein
MNGVVASLLPFRTMAMKDLNGNAVIVAQVLMKQKATWARKLRCANSECQLNLPAPTRGFYLFRHWNPREQLSLITRTCVGSEAVHVHGVDLSTVEVQHVRPAHRSAFAADEPCFQISVQFLVHRVTFLTPLDAPEHVEAAANEAVGLMRAIHRNELSCEYLVDLDRFGAAEDRERSGSGSGSGAADAQAPPRPENPIVANPIVAARFVDSQAALPDALPVRSRLIRRSWNGRFDVQVDAGAPK